MKTKLIWMGMQILSVSVVVGGVITTFTHGMGY